MKRYRVTGIVTGSKYLGEFKANSAEEAGEMALESDEVSVNLCHRCSHQCGDPETLPSDGTWPYQSVQYSLPCGSQTATTNGQKIAWGSSSLYGFSVTSAYNGQRSFPINNFPAGQLYSPP